MVVSPLEASFPRVLLQELYLLKEGQVFVASRHQEGHEEGGHEVFLLRASSKWCNSMDKFSPPQFAKQIDTSSNECVFTLEQKKNFKQPHLMPCPWYTKLACSDSCPSKEAALKASCE